MQQMLAGSSGFYPFPRHAATARPAPPPAVAAAAAAPIFFPAAPSTMACHNHATPHMQPADAAAPPHAAEDEVELNDDAVTLLHKGLVLISTNGGGRRVGSRPRCYVHRFSLAVCE